MSDLLILLAVLISFATLFGFAMAVEKRAAPAGSERFGGVIYALSLAVYCTSWTFYGSVGRAATDGGGFLAVYLGPALLFVFGRPVLARIIRTAKAHHSTSIADLISARHGNSRILARLVTVIAVIGILPYISLQLKAIGTSLRILEHYPSLDGLARHAPPPVWQDPTVHIALVLAVFCVAFGTRRIDATEQHRGLVTVVVLESAIKLLAFLAAGSFVVWGMFHGWGDLLSQAAGTRAASLPNLLPSLSSLDWWAVVLASTAAIVCLPRQFQVLVVENNNPRHLRSAGWIFPLYLAAINLFVLPIAMAGILVLGDLQVPADTFVLTLPIAAQQPWLALLVFIGGLSAATAMVLIEVTALSTMISNDLVMPLILHRLMAAERDPVPMIKAIRRVSIVAVLMLAYVYVRAIGDSRTLVGMGLISFVAAAQFAPALLGGLYLPRPSRLGALWGLVAGFAMWGYTLLFPSFAESGWLGREFLDRGLFGIPLLIPRALFGLGGVNEISHSLFWSLAVNIGGYLIGMAVDAGRASENRQAGQPSSLTIPASSLQDLVGRFIGEERSRQAFADYVSAHDTPLPPEATPAHPFVGLAEKLLAGTIGNASAKIVVAGAFDGEGIDPAHMRGMLKDASAAIETGRVILADALDHLGQGVTVVDTDLRLVAWNSRFVELLALPDGMVAHGTPLAEIMRQNALHGGYGPGDPEELVASRLAWLHKGLPFHDEREHLDGIVLEVRGKPLPNGGYVTTYTDVTRRHRAELELRRAYDELEDRVEARTHELSKEVRVRTLTETALRRSRERLKGITDSLFEGVLVVNTEGLIAFINPSARKLLGIGEEAGDVEGYPLDSVMRIRGRNGEMAFTNSPLGRLLADDTPFLDDDAVFITATGTALEVAYACAPLANEGGQRSVIVSFRDIAALKAAQREALQASRLASVGQLAAGIAHEINTPIQYIGDNLNFIRGAMAKLITLAEAGQELAAATGPSEPAGRFEAQVAAVKLPFLLSETPVAVQETLDGVAQIAKIVLSMKEFSHPGTTEKVVTDINRAIESTLTVSHNVWKQFATVETALAPDLPPLPCFASELNQVFLNLIVNAAQAIEASGKPLPGRIAVTTRVRDGAVEISVADNGTGIPEAIRERIFDPFFTTKEVGKGTGQGLAICRDVVVIKHGGSLLVESEAGQGTMFTVRIPLPD